MKYEDPRGFSGAMVWNTRFIEAHASGEAWSPEMAVVTGVLNRWDRDANTLLVLPIERFNGWLAGALPNS